MHAIWSALHPFLLNDEQLSACQVRIGEEPSLERLPELHQIILQHYKCSEEKLLTCWTQLTGFKRWISDPRDQLHAEFTKHYTIEYCRQWGCAVIEGEGQSTFVSRHPFDQERYHEIGLRLQTKLDIALIKEDELNRLFEKNFHLSGDTPQLEELNRKDIDELQEALSKTDDLLDMANKAPVVKLVNGILFQALQERSSDIHVQPNEDHFVVRYRVDGLLQDVMNLPKNVQDAFTSRLKVMGKMDIAEKRLPQDGTTSFVAAGREVDVRISSLPSIYGERIVMRLQDKSSGVKQLDAIGLSPPHMNVMNNLMNLSHGIILVTGPTGAGKTTTLYAMMDTLNQPDINIITLEDPVELSLPGISQTQVSHKKGLDFSAGLRSIVRQDPDIIMVGEIRDLETARISIQSALTGHLVLSTLHTNDALSALIRLVDIGVEPSMINASLLGVVAQRLVRTLCPECKVEHPNPESHLKSLGFQHEEFMGATLYKEMGCDACHHKGYNGRTAIYEILVLQDATKAELQNGTTPQKLMAVAKREGFLSLRDDGIEKIKLGLTTPDEVFRVTQASGF